MSNITNINEYKESIFRIGDGFFAHNDELLEFVFTSEKELDFFTPLGFIANTFSLNMKEKYALCVCASRLWRYEELPTISQLQSLVGAVGEKFHLVFCECSDKKALCDVARNFIKNGEHINITGTTLHFPTPAELFHSKDILGEIENFCGNFSKLDEAQGAVVLLGKKDSGKTFLLSRLAERSGGTLLTVDASVVPPTFADEIAVTAQLYRSIVCVANAKYGDELIEKLHKRLSLLFFTEEKTPPALSDDTILLERCVKDLSVTERKKAFATLFELDEADVSVDKIASLYSIGIGGLIKAKLKFSAEVLTGKVKKDDFSAITDIIKTTSGSALSETATRLTTNKKLDDVVLPIAQKQQLTEICSFVKNRKKIYSEWDFDSKIPYGKGITALFYGASGTGKTLAATAMANELGLDLYRVDLSQLISKYIGDTQKNIGKVFDEAQNCDCILFFDEADALFSKRTDTQDSQDKHSNAEIAYLLQRTERYDGSIILATNLLQNFDEAFRRRIGFMLHFPMPDERLRQEMWENIFPEKAPLIDINYGFLAKYIELSGAGIRNCAVNAALMAAGENESITMQRIVKAATAEYQKQGKNFPTQVLAMISG